MSATTVASAQTEHYDHVAVKKSAETRLRELDGWRAISVFLVIMAHFVVAQHPGFLMRNPRLAPVLRFCGPLGVGIFFVISGFVICRLLLSEEARWGAVSLKAFYYRRAFRILPPLFLYLTAIFMLISLRLIYDRHLAVLWAAVFAYDTDIAPLSWFVGHTWSLAVEEQFYLLFPAAWIVAPRRWRWWMGIAVFLFCAAWNVSRLYAGAHAVMLRSAPAGFSCISCGILMALCERRARAIAKEVPVVIVALLALLLLLHPVKPDSWQGTMADSLLFPPIAGFLLLFSLERGKWLRAFLCSKIVQAIGITSYGTYLWQELFTASKGTYTPSGHLISYGLPLLALIVPVSYFCVEKPAMRYGKYLSQRAKAASLSKRAIAASR